MNENTRTSMENAIGEIKVSQKSDTPITKYDKTDSLFAIMYIVLGYGFVRYFILDFYLSCIFCSIYSYCNDLCKKKGYHTTERNILLDSCNAVCGLSV